MKKILLLTSMLLCLQLFAQEKKLLDSLNNDYTIVASLDTSKFNYDIDKYGCKTYYNFDSLGQRKNYVIGIESYFDGGQSGWKNFLVENLNINRIGRKLKRKDFTEDKFKQSAEIEFTVCTDGSLCEFSITNDVHPLVKEEALRVIKLSPNWKPGIQSGIIVKSRKKQRITFLVTRE